MLLVCVSGTLAMKGQYTTQQNNTSLGISTFATHLEDPGKASIEIYYLKKHLYKLVTTLKGKNTLTDRSQLLFVSCFVVVISSKMIFYCSCTERNKQKKKLHFKMTADQN